VLRIIWRFRVKPDKSNDFQRIYSWKGRWAKLFGLSPEYQGTILLQEVSDPLTFVVIDRWALRDSFTRFREQFGCEYQRLDEECKELTDDETLVGMFHDELI
jgi:hypothetical protein